MDNKQRDTVYGYVRLNYKDGDMITDVIKIIYQYYLIQIASNIITQQEQTEFMDLLFIEILKQNGNENLKLMDTKLLYRASEQKYSASKFHEFVHIILKFHASLSTVILLLFKYW